MGTTTDETEVSQTTRDRVEARLVTRSGGPIVARVSRSSLPLAISTRPGLLARRTYGPGVEVQRTDGALLRGNERAFVRLRARERGVRDAPEMFLVPVEGSHLVLVDRGRGRGERPKDEQRQHRRDGPPRAISVANHVRARERASASGGRRRAPIGSRATRGEPKSEKPACRLLCCVTREKKAFITVGFSGRRRQSTPRTRP